MSNVSKALTFIFFLSTYVQAFPGNDFGLTTAAKTDDCANGSIFKKLAELAHAEAHRNTSLGNNAANQHAMQVLNDLASISTLQGTKDYLDKTIPKVSRSTSSVLLNERKGEIENKTAIGKELFTELTAIEETLDSMNGTIPSFGMVGKWLRRKNNLARTGTEAIGRIRTNAENLATRVEHTIEATDATIIGWMDRSRELHQTVRGLDRLVETYDGLIEAAPEGLTKEQLKLVRSRALANKVSLQEDLAQNELSIQGLQAERGNMNLTLQAITGALARSINSLEQSASIAAAQAPAAQTVSITKKTGEIAAKLQLQLSQESAKIAQQLVEVQTAGSLTDADYNTVRNNYGNAIAQQNAYNIDQDAQNRANSEKLAKRIATLEADNVTSNLLNDVNRTLDTTRPRLVAPTE